MMREAPLRENRSATRHNARHAPRRHGDKRQSHASMNGKIVHALLSLFSERVAENFPCQFLGAATNFFKRLVNRYRANGHGAVAQNPFARLVNILAGGKIHQRVATPFH